VTTKGPRKGKNPHAVALGRLGGKRRAEVLTTEERRDIGTQGGLVGGRARADSLSNARRSEIAKKAAETRWAKKKRSEAKPTKERGMKE
jgi:hypothetical protein